MYKYKIMNKVSYILHKAKNTSVYDNINIALLSLLKSIKNELDILQRYYEFNNNILLPNKIDDIILYCFINNSDILSQEYHFDMSNFVIVDGFSNIVNVDETNKYAQYTLIQNIKNIYNKITNIQSTVTQNQIIYTSKEYQNVSKESQNVLKESQNVSKESQNMSKEELKKKIEELREKQKHKQENLEIITNTFKKKEQELIDTRNNFEKKKKEANKTKDENEQRIRHFTSAKRSYFLMRSDIHENILDEKNINPEFKKNYTILNEMLHEKDIDSDDDSEDEELIYEQINKFTDKLKKIDEYDTINKFLFDKKIYYSIKKDLEDSKIYESDIPSKFKTKYIVYKTLDNNNIIEDKDMEYNEDTKSIVLSQFKTFADLYEQMQNMKNKTEDKNVNGKKYIPHNINYMEESEKQKILEEVNSKNDDSENDDINDMMQEVNNDKDYRITTDMSFDQVDEFINSSSDEFESHITDESNIEKN